MFHFANPGQDPNDDEWSGWVFVQNFQKRVSKIRLTWFRGQLMHPIVWILQPLSSSMIPKNIIKITWCILHHDHLKTFVTFCNLESLLKPIIANCSITKLAVCTLNDRWYGPENHSKHIDFHPYLKAMTQQSSYFVVQPTFFPVQLKTYPWANLREKHTSSSSLLRFLFRIVPFCY